jgi:hypothetical protein
MHTPGPWHWDSDPLKGDPRGLVRIRVTAKGRTITQLYYGAKDSQAVADGKLIAAAPDLLRALERWKQAQEDRNSVAIVNAQFDRDRAIAKAKGDNHGQP